MKRKKSFYKTPVNLFSMSYLLPIYIVFPYSSYSFSFRFKSYTLSRCSFRLYSFWRYGDISGCRTTPTQRLNGKAKDHRLRFLFGVVKSLQVFRLVNGSISHRWRLSWFWSFFRNPKSLSIGNRFNVSSTVHRLTSGYRTLQYQL